MKNSEDDHIGATNEEVRQLLRSYGAKLGIDYVPYTPTLSEDALLLKELKEKLKESSTEEK